MFGDTEQTKRYLINEFGGEVIPPPANGMKEFKKGKALIVLNFDGPIAVEAAFNDEELATLNAYPGRKEYLLIDEAAARKLSEG